MQIPYPVVDRYSKLIPNTPGVHVSLKEIMTTEPLSSELARADDDIRQMFNVGVKLEGLYRHQSTMLPAWLSATALSMRLCPPIRMHMELSSPHST